jgi:hypothetical protein
MAVHYLTNEEDGKKCFYCTTTMFAFGPVMEEDDDPEDFIAWLKVDPRTMEDSELSSKLAEYQQIMNGKFDTDMVDDIEVEGDYDEDYPTYNFARITSATYKEYQLSPLMLEKLNDEESVFVVDYILEQFSPAQRKRMDRMSDLY